jgi:hypothetical protein
MIHFKPAVVLAFAGTLACGHAQPPAPAAAAGPAVPAASSLLFRSAFDGYRPFSEQAVAPWKQSNDAVREAGGWRAYAREVQRSAQGAAPAASSPSPHAGHHEERR